MEKQDLPHRKIVFVCTNAREDPDKPCCNARGGSALRDKLKEMVKERGLRSKVRISQSGCMDRCEQGPNIMVFPDNVWYSGVEEKDLPAILDSIIQSLDRGD